MMAYTWSGVEKRWGDVRGVEACKAEYIFQKDVEQLEENMDL